VIASVVIPTRDRPEALRRCLDALGRQEDVTLEVVVVDDGGAAGAVPDVLARAHGARVVRLPGLGPAAARNAGTAATTGEIVLLLDDDCVPRPGWARSLAAAVERSRGVVAGQVLAPPDAPVWLRASERLAAQAEDASGFFRTLNLGCPRELLLRVPFDARFTGAAGEDRDWCARAAGAGAAFLREPAAAVEHRATLDGPRFVRQQLQWGAAVHRLRQKGTHARVPARVLGSGLARALQDDPPVAPAMALGLVAAFAGFLGVAFGRSG
jgi:glycosyltransferase involved in cell wall biosynthesis